MLNVKSKMLWEPHKLLPYPKWILYVGVLGLVLYSSFRVLWPDLGKLGEYSTAFFGLIAILVYGKQLRRSAALWLLLAVILVQMLSWWLGVLHHPEWMDSDPKVDRLAKLFIFIGVAWWLGGSTRNTLIVWGLALIFYLPATLIHGDGIHEWLIGLQGERAGFGIRNKQHGAMLFGVALLGIFVFSKRFCTPGKFRSIRILFWCFLLIICSIGVLIGQTRAIWLALLVALSTAGITWLLYKGSSQFTTENLKKFSVSFILLLIVTTGAGIKFHDTLTERIDQESQVISQIAQGEFEDLPYSSIGIRIHTWRAAFDWIEQRPLVGWGGQGRSLVIDHTEWLPNSIKENFGHLHNFFLEIWVAYGILGLTVMGALAVWVGRSSWLAWKGGLLPNDIALFGVIFFVYWMIANQFESYNSFWTGVYVHNIILGGLVTHYWRWQLTSEKDIGVKSIT